MRVLLAFILGVVVTIGAAYLHDTSVPEPSPGTAKRLVNWEAAGELARWSADRARDEWNKLTSK